MVLGPDAGRVALQNLDFLYLGPCVLKLAMLRTIITILVSNLRFRVSGSGFLESASHARVLDPLTAVAWCFSPGVNVVISARTPVICKAS